MAMTSAAQRLVSLEVSARGEEAARSYLEGGLFDAAVTTPTPNRRLLGAARRLRSHARPSSRVTIGFRPADVG